jgi:hypothetical protein
MMHCTVTEWPDGTLTFELTGAPGYRVDKAIKPDVRIVPDPEPLKWNINDYRWLYKDLGGVTWNTNRTGYVQPALFAEATP